MLLFQKEVTTPAVLPAVPTEACVAGNGGVRSPRDNVSSPARVAIGARAEIATASTAAVGDQGRVVGPTQVNRRKRRKQRRFWYGEQRADPTHDAGLFTGVQDVTEGDEIMRSIGWRLPILAMSILSLNRAQARAQEVLYLEAADWIPTASVLTMPTSYVAAGAYVFPTSYAVPTVYATAYLTESALVTPTTYLAPSYYETRFRRRGLFGRRLVETSRAYYIPTTAYYPTTYYYPTTFRSSAIVDAAVMPTLYARTTSTRCCGEVVDTPIVRDLPASSEPARSTVAASPAARSNRREQPPVRSEPAEDDSIPSNVPELPTREADASQAGETTGAQAGSETPKPPSNRVESPPAPQLPRREQSTVRSTPSALTAAKPAAQGQGVADLDTVTDPAAEPKSTTRPGPPASAAPAPGAEVPRPVAPTEGEELQPAPDQTAPRTSGQRRDSQRPVLTTPRSIRPEFRNVLFGRVKARDTSEPEEGVRVSISNRQNTSERREALTDAFGRFAMRVPDGDWTVSVTMPSGRVYSVSQIIVSNGQITDEIGRDVPSLVITR